MNLDITDDNEYLICSSDYPYELQLLKRFLTREIANAWLIKKRQPYLNTERCFINEYGMIPSGLWLEVLQFNKKYNIACNLSDKFKAYANKFQLSYDDFLKWINETFEGAKSEDGSDFAPRDYQIKAAYSLLKYKRCCGEISTSAGKTLISFIIFKYIIDHAGTNKILYIVPSVDLATQSAEKYEQYESYLKNHKHNWKIGILKAGLTKKQKEAVESCNILFGTYQSLCKRTFEFFNPFEGCIVDECLAPDTLISMADNTKKSIKDINPGELVWTYNEQTKEKEILPVKKVYKNLSKNQQMLELTLDNGNILHITGNHKVLTNRGYIRVDQLTINDNVISIGLIMKIKSIKPIDYIGDVYNLHIDAPTDVNNHNYFANEICVSNCHHAGSAESLKNILNKCKNLKYSIGVTGTFPKETTIENLSLQSHIGPVVYKLTADELINKEKSATPVYIIFQVLNWASLEEKRELFYQRMQKANATDEMALGNKLLKQEQEFVNGSYTRLKYIGDLAIKMAKNTLILFGDVKGEYGKKIAEYIKDNSDKNVYYMDGTTPNENREYYKDQCKEDENGKTVIVGSIGTCSEGIDIPNIESIFLVNTAKSERIVRQMVGRGLRLSAGKEKCCLYDFVDNCKYSEDPKKRYYENYMWKHYLERRKIYQEQNFPIFEQKVDFK